MSLFPIISPSGSRTSKDPIKTVKPMYTQGDFDGFDYKGEEIIVVTKCKRF